MFCWLVYRNIDRVDRLKAVEAEKNVLLARAEAAERVLVKGETKDQARMDALTDESRASRLKFLALNERLRQLTRLRDQVGDILQIIAFGYATVDCCRGLRFPAGYRTGYVLATLATKC